MRYKKMYNDVLTERNQFKQQCTQGKNQNIFFLFIY